MLLASGDTVTRWCGPVPGLTQDVVLTALGLAAARTGRSADFPWLIASHHLGPDHWFSVRIEAT